MRRLMLLVALALLGASELTLTACASGNLVVSANSNECMLVPWHGYPIDGTQVRLRQCIGKQNQYWKVANGQISGIGGSCLDVNGAAPVAGARVIYVACNGGPSQHWTYSNGQIVGIGGMCLQSLGGTEIDGVPLIIANCNGSPPQQWQLH
jgi:Ricin-type beta-trefoil lectin domain